MQARTLIASALMTAVLVAAPFSIVTTPAVASPPVGNTIADCDCGAVFTPTAETRYIEYDRERCTSCLEAGEKTFAACSHECRDVAKATRLIEVKLAEHRHAH